MVTTQHKNRCPGGQGIQIFCRAFLFIFIMYSVCLTCARLCPRVERIHQIQTFYSKIILPWDDGSLNLLIRVSLCYRRYILMLLTRCRRRTSYYDRPIIQHLSDSGNLKVNYKSIREKLPRTLIASVFHLVLFVRWIYIISPQIRLYRLLSKS